MRNVTTLETRLKIQCLVLVQDFAHEIVAEWKGWLTGSLPTYGGYCGHKSREPGMDSFSPLDLGVVDLRRRSSVGNVSSLPRTAAAARRASTKPRCPSTKPRRSSTKLGWDSCSRPIHARPILPSISYAADCTRGG